MVAATDIVQQSGIAGEAQPRWQRQANGAMVWGPGGSTPPDTNLYREGANLLATDDSFYVHGSNLRKNVGGAVYEVPASIGQHRYFRTGQFTPNASPYLFAHGDVVAPSFVLLQMVGMGNQTGQAPTNYDLPNATQIRYYGPATFSHRWVAYWT
jgi:hypothetical protein